MKLTLAESAKQINSRPDVICNYINNGLVPTKPRLSAEPLLDDTDMYWLDLVHCFIQNGSSIDDVKQLIKRCNI
ncbi:MerR family transcriptional regulator [Lentilactobacillus kisonensis]|uniref:HTH merR-type domain-containing protein n=1 Tax=Lentilactobacillus kisonensis F0435 TaxID=797516 RepID=H1LDH1_9LACO|nr:MerR family transcriptional regulator [Lentilactobacillus kisonensis]EHO53210.1 hypothetical protein HMPREF9104_00639 [Lentilactobacillus kisonensis F0435]